MKNKLIKILLILGLLMVIFSCQNNIITEKTTIADGEFSYVVKKIMPFGDRSKYWATTGFNYIQYDNDITFIEENGKFAIGDTIYINFSNKPLLLDSLNKTK